MKTVLITGGNRGIGKEIVKKLIKHKMNIIFTCRDLEQGEFIFNEFKRNENNSNSIKFYTLDIENISSVNLLANQILYDYGKIDVLVNNAGYFDKEDKISPYENVSRAIKTFSVNYYGNLLLTSTLLKFNLISQKILFSSSSKGILNFENNQYNDILRNVSSLKDIDNFINKYIDSVRNNKPWVYFESEKFNSYGPSKMALNSLNELFSKKFTNLIFASFTPGPCKTDMCPDANRTPEEGSEICEWLINTDIDAEISKNGKFFYYDKSIKDYKY